MVNNVIESGVAAIVASQAALEKAAAYEAEMSNKFAAAAAEIDATTEALMACGLLDVGEEDVVKSACTAAASDPRSGLLLIQQLAKQVQEKQASYNAVIPAKLSPEASAAGSQRRGQYVGGFFIPDAAYEKADRAMLRR